MAVPEGKISDRLASAYGLPAKPGVGIAGFPFLTQVLSGSYHTVHIDVPSVLAGGVRVTQLDTRFTGVRASLAQVLGRSPEPVTAQAATATGTVPPAALRRGLPPGVTLRQQGHALNVAGTTHYLGVAVPYSASVQPSASSAGITLTPRQVQVGHAAHLPARTLAGRLRFTIPLGALPLHLRISSVRVGPAGLDISATGRDVQFATGG